MPQPAPVLQLSDLISDEQFTEILNFAGNHHQKTIDSYRIHLLTALNDFQITNKKRVAGFLAQVCAESFGLIKDKPVELANKTGTVSPISTHIKGEKFTGDRDFFNKKYNTIYVTKNELLRPKPGTAKKFLKKNNTLENFGPNDGFDYRGRGPIQITGHAMYHSMQGLIAQKIDGRNIEKDPDLVANDKTVGLIVAAAVFESKGCNDVADQVDPDKEESIHETNRHLTRLINGHANGLDIRLKYYVKALEILVGHVTPSIYNHEDIRDPLEFLSRSTFLDKAEMSFIKNERTRRQKSIGNKVPQDVQDRISANIAAYKKAHPEQKFP